MIHDKPQKSQQFSIKVMVKNNKIAGSNTYGQFYQIVVNLKLN